SVPCTPRNSCATVPSPAPPDQAPGYSNSPAEGLLARPQLNVSGLDLASPDLDTEGLPLGGFEVPDPAPCCFYVAWRGDPRPLGGVIQGAYVFSGITAFGAASGRPGPARPRPTWPRSSSRCGDARPCA